MGTRELTHRERVKKFLHEMSDKMLDYPDFAETIFEDYGKRMREFDSRYATVANLDGRSVQLPLGKRRRTSNR